MKKHVLSFVILVIFAAFCFGQTAPAKTDNPPKKATTTASTKTAPGTGKSATASKTASTKAASVSSVKPTTATAAGPTKKDGTADMRYKANKGVAKTPPTTHVKKDGTPDKRYKENKKQ